MNKKKPKIKAEKIKPENKPKAEPKEAQPKKAQYKSLIHFPNMGIRISKSALDKLISEDYYY